MASHTVKVRLNPDLLVWARESAGFKLSDIASFFKKPEEAIAAWEDGTASPTFRQLEGLARKVKRPLTTFFLPKPPPEPPLPKDFRVLPSRDLGIFDSDTLIAFRQARFMLSETIELLDILEISLSMQLPRFTRRDNPETEAAEFRTHLGISIEMQLGWRDKYEALDAWRAALFDLGVFIFHFPMRVKDARGFSIEDEDLGVIGLSTKDDPVARCFSLFHEVCHLCLGKPGVSAGDAISTRRLARPEEKLEAYCDRFSASVLLPLGDEIVRSALEGTFNNRAGWDKGDVIRVARKFKVSKYVMLRRALDADHLTQNLFWDIFRKWRNEDKPPSGSGGNYINNQISARGKRFVSLVFEALDSGKISLHEASDYLSLQPKHFGDARESAGKVQRMIKEIQHSQPKHFGDGRESASKGRQ